MVELRRLALIVVAAIILTGFLYFAFGYLGNRTIQQTTEPPIEEEQIEISKNILSIENIEFGSPTTIQIQNIGYSTAVAETVWMVIDGKTHVCEWIDGLEHDEVKDANVIPIDGLATCEVNDQSTENSAIFVLDISDIHTGIVIVDGIDFESQTVTVVNIYNSPVLIDHINFFVNDVLTECVWDLTQTRYDSVLNVNVIDPQNSTECTLQGEFDENQGFYTGIPNGFEDYYQAQLEWATTP